MGDDKNFEPKDRTHKELNEKAGHKGRFIEDKNIAEEYYRKYKKDWPMKPCFIYPIREAIYQTGYVKEKKRQPKNYHAIVEYKIIGYLISTPNEPDRRESSKFPIIY